MALIGAIGERGYTATTVADIVARAGVSRKTFYQHFAGKQECFLVVYDAITAEGMRRVQSAYYATNGWPDRAESAIRVLFESAIENPDALRLIMVEIGAVGRTGIEHRELVMAQYARFMRDGLDLAPGKGTVPDITLRAVVGGVNRVLYARLYDRQHGRLLGLVPELVRWATSYYPAPEAIASGQPALPPSSLRTRSGLLGGRAPGTLSLGAHSNWLASAERGVSSGLVVHSQRERILDAVANLTAATGYGALGIKNIAAEAGISLKTFYEHFSGKEDAFLVAYEIGYIKALAIFERAYAAEPDWPSGMRAALASLLNFLASEPSFARLAIIDSLIATARTADSSVRSITKFARLLEPGFHEAPERDRPPDIAIEAIAGGIFELIFHYIVQGRVRELPELAPQVTYVALAPFLGAEEAGRVAASIEAAG